MQVKFVLFFVGQEGSKDKITLSLYKYFIDTHAFTVL